MPTTSQLLGLTPSQRAAAVFTAAGEAGPGNDALGVLQTILIRKVKSNKNIADLVKEPQQFVANDPYSLSQVADSRYGQKVYGARYKQIERMFENPDLMADALRKAKGAEEFRGQTLLKNKLPSDFMFDPKGNFYFNLNPKLANTLAEKLSRLSPQSAVPDQSGQQSSVQQTTPFEVKPFEFEKELNKKLTENLISSANKIDSSNDYLRASSLLNLASDLEDSSDPLDQEAANIYKSKAMEVMFKSTPLTDPIDLINTYINVTKDQEEYTQKASNLEKLVNDVRQSLAQNVGKNIENASEPTQNIDGGLIFGDSIASGYAGRSGGNQVLIKDARGMSMVGASPSQVLNQLISYGKGKFKDQTVHLSSGITNNNSDLASVESQLKFLRDSGAKINLLGVTNKPPADLQKGLGNMNSKLEALANKYGASFSGGFTPSSDGIHPAESNPTQKIAYKDVTITNPNDTGGLGFDFVIEGGRRGARFASPFSAEVLKVTKDPREFRLEEGATTRSYGNNVELRFKTPQGKAVDVLIAHFDDLNPDLKPGQLIKPGKFLGTQGRSGSTYWGPHVSMDLYNPGSNSADAEVIKIKNLIRDRIAKGLPVFG